ncbi:hypothetical protein [Microbispora catharanthi]|uniref:Uncharacterized protein n=1 Tax=Microbispora catharanthi TaxID=1712871 RepID=A0A5N6BU20_9ACTN|nr:hypothetical protein [Microbispora catharanthi]KAB8183803.1 hypothetical protein FH610_019330 [Microbispora catharanthi]
MSSPASGSRGTGRLLMWSAAVAVTCATVGLSGSVAASATPAKAAPATQAATSPQGGGEKDNKSIPYPRLDSANIVTAFTIGATSVTPTESRTFTGSARRGRVFVHDGTDWADLTSVFSPGYLYDVTLAPAPSTAFALTGGVLTRLGTSGIPVGLVRVTVRKADGSLFYSDCSVSNTSGASTLPLVASRCTAPTRL